MDQSRHREKTPPTKSPCRFLDLRARRRMWERARNGKVLSTESQERKCVFKGPSPSTKLWADVSEEGPNKKTHECRCLDQECRHREENG